jgi:hypothetical protein
MGLVITGCANLMILGEIPSYPVALLMFNLFICFPSLHDDRRRLLDSTYLTRVNVLKFANLFQSRNKIKLRHLCKFIKIIFSKTRPINIWT